MKFSSNSAAYTTLGFELIGLILAMFYLGSYLDKNYGWNGWGLISGLVIAFAGWLTHVVIVVQMLDKQGDSGDTDAK